MTARTLDGISQIEMACSLKVNLDRMMMTWDNLGAYMDAINQIVPPHATVSFTDQGDNVLLQFIWAESREVQYRVEQDRIETRQETLSEPQEAASEPAKAVRGRGVSALPRRG